MREVRLLSVSCVVSCYYGVTNDSYLRCADAKKFAKLYFFAVSEHKIVISQEIH